MNDIQDLAEALAELNQTDAAKRLQKKGVMPDMIYCSQTNVETYTALLSMYAPVKSNWLIRDDRVKFMWEH